MFRNICVYTYLYMHAITISEERGDNLEDQEGVQGWTQKEEKEG